MRFWCCHNLSGFQTKEHCSFCHVYLENTASLPASVLIFLHSELRNCLHSHILPLALISCATVWTTSVGSQKLLCTLVRLLLPCNCSRSQMVKKTLLSKFTNQQNQSYSSSSELFTASFQCVWFKSGRPICQPVLGARLLSRYIFFLKGIKGVLHYPQELQIASNLSWQTLVVKSKMEIIEH